MIIQSRRIWIAGQFIPPQIIVEGDKIAAIHPYGKYTADIDYREKRIVPGFIDIHTHGAYGFDTNDAENDIEIKGLRNWIKNIPREGVTGLLPTTVTQEPAVLAKALKNIASAAKEDFDGAEILGIHLEGPFLDMRYKGAQSPEAISKPTIEQFALYQNAARGLIKYITLAPEHDEDFALTKYCRAAGVVVSMGHSSAAFECALMGIANGATSVTHVYNGMPPIHHREPGLAGLALRTGNTYGEIIADGRHSRLAAAAVFYQAKGKDINPARCLGIDDRKGKLAAGHDADIVVLEDDYRVCQTYCRGRQLPINPAATSKSLYAPIRFSEWHSINNALKVISQALQAFDFQSGSRRKPA